MKTYKIRTSLKVKQRIAAPKRELNMDNYKACEVLAGHILMGDFYDNAGAIDRYMNSYFQDDETPAMALALSKRDFILKASESKTGEAAQKESQND